MKQSDRIRALAAKGVSAAHIASELGASRQAVYEALRASSTLGAPSRGKDGCRIALRCTAELCAAIDKAQKRGETRTDCITRLIERGLAR